MEHLGKVIGLSTTLLAGLGIKYLGCSKAKKQKESKSQPKCINHLVQELQDQAIKEAHKINHLDYQTPTEIGFFLNPLFKKPKTCCQDPNEQHEQDHHTHNIVKHEEWKEITHLSALQPNTLLLKACPRQNIYFCPVVVKVAIVVSGGAAPGTNAAIKQVVNTFWRDYGVKEIYGIVGGFPGFYSKTKQPVKLTPQCVKGISHEGGSIIGSAKGVKFCTSRIVDEIDMQNFNIVIVIGGEGSVSAVKELNEQIKKRRIKAAAALVPKSIDNNIPLVFQSIGFTSAVDKASQILNACIQEEQSRVEQSVVIIKSSGLHSSSFSTHVCINNKNVDIVLVPELHYHLDGDKGVLHHVIQTLKQKSTCVLFVCEDSYQGCKDRELKGFQDKANGLEYSDYLEKEIESLCQQKAINAHVVCVNPWFAIRGLNSQCADVKLAKSYAKAAVHGLIAGYTNFTVTTAQSQTDLYLVPLDDKHIPQVDVRGQIWSHLCEITHQPSFLGSSQVQEKQQTQTESAQKDLSKEQNLKAEKDKAAELDKKANVTKSAKK